MCVATLSDQMEDRMMDRRRNFKKGAGGAEDARRAREDETIQIRKKEREEQLARRRRMGEEEEEESKIPVGVPKRISKEVQRLPEFLHDIQNGSAEVKQKAAQSVRRMLSIDRSPPIQEVIDMGFVPYFVELLKAEQYPEIQFEVAWALTNIASGTAEQTLAVTSLGAIPLFVTLLSSPNSDLREQCVWALGNIAGDNPSLRDQCIRAGMLEQLLQVLRTSEKQSMVRNAVWALGNACRGKPPAPLQHVSIALPALANLIHHEDLDVVSDSLWALSYITDGSNDRIQAVIESGVVNKVVELLKHESVNVITPALRTVGNIVTGDDLQTNTIVRAGAIPLIAPLLSHTRKNIKKEACWALSNVTAGTKEQIQEVINAGCFPKLIERIINSEFEIKKEAVWAISNATTDATSEQIEYIVQCGAIGAICSLLKINDNRVILVVLEGLDHILKSGDEIANRRPEFGGENPYLRLVEECDGLTAIENLQTDENEEVYHKAVRILEYFPQEGQVEAHGQEFGIPQNVGGFSF